MNDCWTRIEEAGAGGWVTGMADVKDDGLAVFKTKPIGACVVAADCSDIAAEKGRSEPVGRIIGTGV